MRPILALILFVIAVFSGCQQSGTDRPAVGDAEILPSWNEGPTRAAIVDFVARVTDPSGPDFVPEAQRIAVFDNDGTLWAEKPAYFQLLFAMDRVRALAGDHPEWREQQPFRAVLERDMETLHAAGTRGILELVMATHGGMTTDEFDAVAREWLATARHPTRDLPFTEMVYQPMLELMTYLRTHGFQTWIVSGGGLAFMRPWTEGVYGIPPEQVVGSSIETEFRLRDDVPEIVRLPQIHFVDDKETKPVAIERFIGRRPIAAFGNSDGDLQMLQWTTAGSGARLGAIVHHTDAEREWAYDRESSVGHLEQALAEAPARGWIVVDMARDWARVFPGDG